MLIESRLNKHAALLAEPNALRDTRQVAIVDLAQAGPKTPSETMHSHHTPLGGGDSGT
jgi:hypothetical protein